MTTDQLQAAIHTVPFRPFTIRMADGQQIPILHPDFVAHRPGAHSALVWIGDDSHKVLDLRLVTRFDFEIAPTTTHGS